MKHKSIKRILNYTKHEIRLLCGNGEPILIPRTGVVRTGTNRITTEKLSFANAIFPVNEITFFDSSFMLPPPEDGTIIIVSSLTSSTMSEEREDVYIVDELIKDRDGRVVGARSLARPPKIQKSKN